MEQPLKKLINQQSEAINQVNDCSSNNTIQGNNNRAVQGDENFAVQGDDNTVNQNNGKLNISNSRFEKLIQADKVTYVNVNFREDNPKEEYNSSELVHIEKTKCKATFILSGTIDKIDETFLKALEIHLKEKSKDIKLTILMAEEGSIKITLEASQESLELFKILFESGELTEILGLSIEDVQILRESSGVSSGWEMPKKNPKDIKMNLNKLYLDFSGQNLRGRSFKGQELEGADFSHSDIRGANFTNAKLRGANFTEAKAGLQKRWAIFLVLVSWCVSGLSGFIWLLSCGGLVSLIYLKSSNEKVLNQIFGSGSELFPEIAVSSSLLILVAFLLITIFQGLRAGTITIVVTGSLSLAVAGIGSIVGIPAITGLVAGVIAVVVVAVLVATVIGSIAVGIVVAVVGDIAIAGSVAVSVIGTGIVGISLNSALGIALFISVCGILFSTYIGWRAIKGDEKYAFIRNITVPCAAFKGTSFNGANLTESNFREARLKSTDFRKTVLIRTYWRNAQLNHIRPGTTYLHNIQVQQLLVTGKGENQNYDRLDLRGINLHEANLENASFIDTDFYQANLQKANLSRSILVRTNFERSDIRSACLTGSCIQDWIISQGTKLDGIVCDYVYLKWINKDKRDQMPPRGKFKEGGFVTFIKYILDTVELYHEKDINPRLVLAILQKMSRDYDEPLDIVAIGKRGEKVFIQIKVSENIIRENFKEDYYSRYDTDLKLWLGNNHQLPSAVNSFIENRINEIISERADDFVFVDVNYVEGDINMTGDRIINMGGGNYNERIAGDYVQGNKYTGQPQSLAEAAAEIQALLKQLEQTYPTATTSEKMVVAAQAVDQIETNPLLKQRVVNAIKEGSLAAFEKAIDNPVGAFVVHAIEGWQEVRKD